MLTVSNKNLFKRITISDHSLIEFENDVQLNVTFYDKMNIYRCNIEEKLSTVSTSCDIEIDIGEIMKTRAKNNYGVQDFVKNMGLISENSFENDVRYLWNWLDRKLSTF